MPKKPKIRFVSGVCQPFLKYETDFKFIFRNRNFSSNFSSFSNLGVLSEQGKILKHALVDLDRFKILGSENGLKLYYISSWLHIY